MCDFEESTSIPESEIQPPSEVTQPRSPYASSPFTGYYDTHTPKAETLLSRPRHARKAAPRVGVLLLAATCLVAGAAIGNRSAAKSQAALSQLEARVNALQTQLDGIERDTPVLTTPLPAGEVMTPAQVYARNVHSVVGINCESVTAVAGQTLPCTVSGSGFILSADGYVVTNYHVVENATKITVITQDQKTWEATLVGRDNSADMAVVKIDAENLQPVTLGSSSDLAIGDMVVAIGNPLTALEATQTVGYISGKNREITTENNVVHMLQTDAAINSGNSGGPLLNMRGEVVGITTAKYSGSSASGVSIEGMSFAIPIDDLKSGLQDLQTQGYISSAYLGITGLSVDADAVELYGLPNGVLVDSVEPGGAADQAGIHPKDIITALGDSEITGFTALSRAMRSFRPGDTTTITVYRGGRSLILDITMGERPQATAPTDDNVPEPEDDDLWFRYFDRFFSGTP